VHEAAQAVGIEIVEVGLSLGRACRGVCGRGRAYWRACPWSLPDQTSVSWKPCLA